MQAYAQTLRRPEGPALGLAVGATAVLIVAAAALELQPLGVVVLVNAVLLALWCHRFVLRWEIQVSTVVLTILLVPLGRYELPGNLPFHLEPYRVLVAVIAAGWLATLLSDPALRWRRIGLFGPLVLLSVGILASDALNTDRIEHHQILPEVIKSLTMMLSYWVVLLLVTSVITRREQLEVVLKALVGGGAVVGLFALIQYRTGFNIFDHLHAIPLLDVQDNGVPAGLEERGGDTRVYASAQHPIALSAALVMLLPIGIYVGRRYRSRLWWTATALIGVASISTVARTGSTMLLTVLLVFIALKPRDMLKLWKWAVPFVIAVHFLAPGALGSLKSTFLPEEGLIAQQQTATSATGSNRLADAGPALREWWQRPYVGYGFGTRITTVGDPKVNAFILDNQWLGLLLEVGIVGAVALLWLLLRSVRRLGRAARGDPTEHGWLLSALAASIAAYGIGMITFDSLAFVQVTFLLFILIGLSIPALRMARDARSVPAGGVPG
jgi:polysaccharide biosynthesis protein PslJ